MELARLPCLQCVTSPIKGPYVQALRFLRAVSQSLAAPDLPVVNSYCFPLCLDN